ncbi:hypothetical protein NDU88_000908 [Pleurodeles waltl]|uniref:Uncharacterized protein n=1 Tax=Pleurodeles waltl TaxID=8319 RepID=A0AAV7TGV0_PLEWA|nr:hypothetical protein NDU88_000908 [Pleurodeles waltl]
MPACGSLCTKSLGALEGCHESGTREVIPRETLGARKALKQVSTTLLYFPRYKLQYQLSVDVGQLGDDSNGWMVCFRGQAPGAGAEPANFWYVERSK